MSTEAERLQAAFERGYAKGWEARGQQAPVVPGPPAYRPHGMPRVLLTGHTDERGRYHPPECTCERCDGP